MYRSPNTIRQMALDYREQQTNNGPGKDPYLKGYYAAFNGKPLKPTGDKEEKKLWTSGWNEARAEINKLLLRV